MEGCVISGRGTGDGSLGGGKFMADLLGVREIRWLGKQGRERNCRLRESHKRAASRLRFRKSNWRSDPVSPRTYPCPPYE